MIKNRETAKSAFLKKIVTGIATYEKEDSPAFDFIMIETEKFEKMKMISKKGGGWTKRAEEKILAVITYNKKNGMMTFRIRKDFEGENFTTFKMTCDCVGDMFQALKILNFIQTKEKSGYFSKIKLNQLKAKDFRGRG